MIKKTSIAVVVATTLLLSCIGNRESKQEGDNSASDFETMDSNTKDMLLFVGTYTSPEGSEGVYVYKFDTDTGESDSLSMVEVDNPSYLTLSPDERFVYAVSEQDGSNSSVHAFSLNKEYGRLEHLNSRPTNSKGPCYITIDSKGKHVHTANYGGGSISSLRVNDDGSLAKGTVMMQFNGSGPDTLRQKKAHPHSVRYSPDDNYLFASDLGSDKMYRLTVSNTPFEGQPAIQENSLKEFVTPPGTGPRHFDFHPDGGKYIYVLGELSGEVIVYDYNYGDLQQKQVVASDTLGARGSADIHVSPDGRFLYTSNRLQGDGIAIFSINQEDGTLERVGYQPTVKHPRNFVIAPNGDLLLVAGRDDNKIQVFKIEKNTGLLADTGQDINVVKPACLKFANIN